MDHGEAKGSWEGRMEGMVLHDLGPLERRVILGLGRPRIDALLEYRNRARGSGRPGSGASSEEEEDSTTCELRG